MKKILPYILITVLLSIIFAELFAFYYLQYLSPKETSLIIEPTSQQLEPTGPVNPLTYGECNLRTCENWFPTASEDQAIPELQLVSLRDLKKGVLTSSQIAYTAEGEISNISYSELNEIAQVSFTLTSPTNAQNILYYGENYTKVLDVDGNQIGFNTLTNGQNIRIEIIYDLLNERYESSIITLL